ncbi:hypothetical protein HPB48_015775 [Haemaphysalis longicornis]|uniref:Uncharacterized protein n=1 Tax=Haemaphysalis longicornis TaxID=44386 RepID=A0A9J6GAW6_HAELO|nr:hypothetical protein HPB48_015775 [Haemaphysalis longicornis]
MKGKQGYSCYGTLLLDEVKVRKAVPSEDSRLKVDDFIDLRKLLWKGTRRPRIGDDVCAFI